MNYSKLSRRQRNQLAMVMALTRGDFDKAREFAQASKPTRLEHVTDIVRRVMRQAKHTHPAARL